MRVCDPAIIVGDIHGQYFDFCHLIDELGGPEFNNWLFLGDYVDRGRFGIEVMILLLCWKINFPKKVILLRGNHESRDCTARYGFRM